MNDSSFIDSLRNFIRYGGMTVKIIAFNAILFLLIQIIDVYARLMQKEATFSEFIEYVFTLNTDLSIFFNQPWALITSIFAHFTFMHFAFNMIFMYFSGKMFEQIFDQKRLLYTYILGGLCGGILEIIAHSVFPALQDTYSVIVGASGSIMAIFLSLAFYRPNLKVMLFGIFPIRLFFLALFFLVSDLISLGLDDGTAHFAHIGGALFGILSVYKINSSNNIVNRLQMIGDRLSIFFSKLSSIKPKKKKSANPRFKTDEEYNMEKKSNQQKTDKILDKISKSGYDSLSKKEKDFLFNQSKK